MSCPMSQQTPAVISDEALKKAEEFIEAEEGATNQLAGWLGTAVALAAIVMSLFHLYAALSIMPTHILRGIHVAFMLVLVFTPPDIAWQIGAFVLFYRHATRGIEVARILRGSRDIPSLF